MKAKKHGMVVFCLLLAATCSFLSAGEKKLTLSLKGGMGLIGSCGDMKSYFDSNRSRMQLVGFQGQLGYEYSGQALNLALSADWKFSHSFSLRLEAGHTSSTWKNELDYSYNFGNPGTCNGTDTYKLAAIPITLAPLFTIPMGKAMLRIGAGPTLYLYSLKFEGKYLYSEPTRPGKSNWTWDLRHAFESDMKTAFGGRAFASIGYEITKRISLFLEGGYRLAKVTDIRGTYNINSKATWNGGSETDWFEAKNSFVWFSSSTGSGQTLHYMDFSPTQPTSSDTARHFDFDLGGAFASIGIGITL